MAYANAWRSGAAGLSRAAVNSNLKQNTAGIIQKVANIGRNNARAKDWVGAAKERLGLSTGKNHIQEMRQSIRSLEKASDNLQGQLQRQGDSMTDVEKSTIQAAINYADKLRARMQSVVGS